MEQNKSNKNIWISISAILGVVIMETVALCNGIDGTLLMVSIGAVCGLGGYQLSSHINRCKG